MKKYFTLTGCDYYMGTDLLEKNMVVTLEKDPKNEYDFEAIKVKLPGIGQIGNVANSHRTVVGETMSAGRLYDKIGDEATAKVRYLIPGGAICEVVDEELELKSDDGKSETDDHKHKSDDANKLEMDSPSSIKYTEPDDYFPKEIREKYFKEE